MTSSAPSPEYFGVDRVTGRGFRSVVTITRPSDTTAYTAGDVVGDTGGSAIIALASIGPASGYVIVQSASLVFSDSSVPSGMTSFRLHFHSASPTAIADADAARLLGVKPATIFYWRKGKQKKPDHINLIFPNQALTQ